MKLVIFIFLFWLSTLTDCKKFKEESKKSIGKFKPSPPAIIAIEIVDPNENKTSKNSKRTIDSALGYGYQSPPKFQVYKYSQHDIPPYRGPSNVFSNGIKSHNIDVQKSVSYNLPTKTYNLNQYYQPGTTLYSTVNNQGQAEGLSSHLPQNDPQIPVIILRVYPNQLNDPSSTLHPNLPSTHPLASVVNSIDVQALLSKYVQNLLVDQQQPQYQNQQHYQYQQPAQEYHYQQPHQDYQYQYVQNDELLTHENYPKETHTRVIFRTDKNKLGVSPPSDSKSINIHIPDGAYSSVQVQTPHMHYGYTSPAEEAPQQYYYPQENDNSNYYYQHAEGENQQEDIVLQPIKASDEQNYHRQQKRSKKTKHSRSRPIIRVHTVRS